MPDEPGATIPIPLGEPLVVSPLPGPVVPSIFVVDTTTTGATPGVIQMPMDDTINKVLDQAFAKSHQRGLDASDRASAGDDNLAELTRHVFLGETQKVGTREAAAMQRMDTDKLSEKILDARAAAQQPGFAPAGGSAAGAGAAGK